MEIFKLLGKVKSKYRPVTTISQIEIGAARSGRTCWGVPSPSPALILPRPFCNPACKRAVFLLSVRRKCEENLQFVVKTSRADAGVTKPALYGVNLRLKKPMIGIMAGAAVGGVVAGLLGATAYVYGYSTILALLILQQTMWAMAIAIAVDIVVAALVTAILGFEDKPSEE